MRDSSKTRSVKASGDGGKVAWALACGFILVGLSVMVAALSRNFAYGRVLTEQPVVTIVALKLLSGAVFLAAAFPVSGNKIGGPKALVWILCLGAAMRVAMFFSEPILEHDFYRYLWDGAVTARGMNPYKYSPLQAAGRGANAPEEVLALASDARETLSRINHPELRTIYPVTAQAAFASAHLVGPWRLAAWKLVLAVFDCATLALVLLALRGLSLPACWALIYWWNPLVVHEAYNAAHMDLIALPFVLAAILLGLKRRGVGAVAALALAVGAKLWPMTLLPVALEGWRSAPRRLGGLVGLFGLLCLALFLPVFLAGLGPDSGFVAYGGHWRVNDSLFRLLSNGVNMVYDAFPGLPGEGPLVTRVLAALILLFWIVWLNRSAPERPTDVWDRALLTVAAVFLLSPAGFPWYFLWLAPFLAIRPNAALLTLNCALPLYYLVFYYRGLGDATPFDRWIVLVEYLPPAAVLAYQWLGGRADMSGTH